MITLGFVLRRVRLGHLGFIGKFVLFLGHLGKLLLEVYQLHRQLLNFGDIFGIRGRGT